MEPVTAAELGASWQPGCPVEPGRLRRVNVDHIGFDGQTHHGELIVHEDLVPEVIAIFEQLYRLGYPVEKIARSTTTRTPMMSYLCRKFWLAVMIRGSFDGPVRDGEGCRD